MASLSYLFFQSTIFARLLRRRRILLLQLIKIAMVSQIADSMQDDEDGAHCRVLTPMGFIMPIIKLSHITHPDSFYHVNTVGPLCHTLGFIIMQSRPVLIADKRMLSH